MAYLWFWWCTECVDGVDRACAGGCEVSLRLHNLPSKESKKGNFKIYLTIKSPFRSLL